jgi:F-type H+-transporting ATPase subunit gamma
MNLRQTRKKIKSVTNVKKITKAMQMISAIKMKKAQAAAIEGRPYDEELRNLISKVIPKVNAKYSPLLKINKEITTIKKLAIIIASNKGLCGGFNINLFRFITQSTEFKETDFVIIGKKATYIGRLGGNITADFSSNSPLNNISAVFSLALNSYLKGEYKEIVLYYNKFKSVIKSEPVKMRILPIEVDFDKESSEVKEKILEYKIEPSPQKIVDQLLKSYVEEMIKNAIIESEASEHSSRMMAMKNATDNAVDVIYNLTLLRNKIRQQNITYELLDMVSAKSSVE